MFKKNAVLKVMVFCCAISLFATPVFSEKPGEYLHYRLGMKYKAEKQYDKAIEEFRKVLSEYPDNYNVYMHIAEIRYLQNQPELAIPNLKQALTYNPGWSKAHKMLADAYSKDGQSQKSIAEYQQYQQSCDPAERDSVQKVIDNLVVKIGKNPPPTDDNADSIVDDPDDNADQPIGQKNNTALVTPQVNSPDVKPVATIQQPTNPGTAKPVTAPAPEATPTLPTKSIAAASSPTSPAVSNTPDLKPVKSIFLQTQPSKSISISAMPSQAVALVPDDPKAAALFKQACRSYHAQQYELALKQLKQVIALQPGFPGAYYYAGLIRFERDEHKLAKINLTKAKYYDEPEHIGLLYKGKLSAEEKDYPGAVHQLSRFVKSTASENLKKQGRELLGAYRKLLNTSDSTEDIDTTGLVAGKPGIPTGPLLLEVRIDSLLTMVTSDTLSDAGQKLIAGIRAFQCGDYDKAVREFKKTLASYPSGPIAVQCLYDIGVSYFKLRLLKEAENQFQQILDRYPTHELAAQSSFLKALAYSEQKETVVAEQLFREFLLSHRGHRWEGKAWEKLGDTYVDLDQPKKAIDAYAQAAGKTGNFEDQVCAWYKTGNAFALIGNSVRACAAFDSAIALGERHKIFTRVPDSYYRIADEKYKSKEYTGAQTYYEAVIRKFPDFQETPWAIFQIGNVHKNLQQFKEAIESYNDLIKNYPEDYWAKQAKWKLDDAVWEHEYQTALH